MKKVSFILIFLILQLGCSTQPIARIEVSNRTVQTQIVADNSAQNFNDSFEAEYQEAVKNYPGKTIDQIFPFIENHDFKEEDFGKNTHTINAENFQVKVKGFTPNSISRNGKTLFNFKTLYQEGYWASLVGISRLLGANSKEIYVVASGTGGVCCTNYWITDISSGKPRNIFRSEDFGSFREPMEIFDADGDGVYELVQFDSAFRYFMDDCGTCSPEPRAVFKYDKSARTYLPTKGIQQDFEKENFARMGKWLAESFEKLKTENDPGLENQFYRSLKAHVVNLLWIGNEKKAWKLFDRYMPNDSYKAKVRREINDRLRQSKFYQALKKRD